MAPKQEHNLTKELSDTSVTQWESSRQVTQFLSFSEETFETEHLKSLMLLEMRSFILEVFLEKTQFLGVVHKMF